MSAQISPSLRASGSCTIIPVGGGCAWKNQADFTDPITAGILVSVCAWASFQRSTDETPYWRTLKANGELNPKYPGGTEAQKVKLEAEGHTIIQKDRTNIRYFVKDYEAVRFELF